MTLIATRLQNFRSDNPDIAKWEYRTGNYGAWNLFSKQSQAPNSIINNDLRSKAIAAVGSGLEIPVIDYKASTIQNVTQPVAVIDDPLTSKLMAVSFTDYYFGFLMYDAQFYNNNIDPRQYFNTQMRRWVLALLNEWDQDALTVLETNKTQVLGSTLGGKYTLTGDVISGTNAFKDQIIGDINPLMRGNDFSGPFDIVGNPSLESHVRNNLLEKGANQDSNKTYQWNDKSWHFSNNVADAALQAFTGFAVQSGSVGVLDQFLPDNVWSHKSNNHQWRIMDIPGLGGKMGTYTYDGAVDASGLNASTTHLTATKVQAYGFHVRKAFVHAYNSDLTTIASATGKFQIAQ